jgi:transposase-like protein
VSFWMERARRVGIPAPATTSAACRPIRLRVPKLRQQTFETAIIERYRRRENSVEEALIEMYLAGAPARKRKLAEIGHMGNRASVLLECLK